MDKKGISHPIELAWFVRYLAYERKGKNWALGFQLSGVGAPDLHEYFIGSRCGLRCYRLSDAALEVTTMAVGLVVGILTKFCFP